MSYESREAEHAYAVLEAKCQDIESNWTAMLAVLGIPPASPAWQIEKARQDQEYLKAKCQEQAKQIAGLKRIFEATDEPISRLFDIMQTTAGYEYNREKSRYFIEDVIEFIQKQAAYIAKLEAAFLQSKELLIWEEIDRDQLELHYKDVNAPWMSSKEKGEYVYTKAREALEKLRK